LTLIIIATTKTFGQPLKDSVVDIDGNVYHTIKIGTHIWLMENLKVTHYRNGDVIPTEKESWKMTDSKTGSYFTYIDDTNNIKSYERQYNWFVLTDPRIIAPIGYHIATFEDWCDLMKQFCVDSTKIKIPLDGDIKIKDTTDLFSALNVFHAYKGGWKAKNILYWWLPPRTLDEQTCCDIFGAITFFKDKLLFECTANLQTMKYSLICVKD